MRMASTITVKTTYMRSRSAANPQMENITRATGVAIRNNNPNWMMPRPLSPTASRTIPAHTAKI